MQKVEGSSPFIRSWRNPAFVGRFGWSAGGKPNSGEQFDGRVDWNVRLATTSRSLSSGPARQGWRMGYFLRRPRRRFVILERAESIGPAWRERWESLTLFTPRRYSALPGLPLPGDPDGYPTRDEVIAYLERYAETFELPIELNSEVAKLERGDDGRFRLEVDGRTIVPTRSSSRPGRSRCRTCRSSPSSSVRMSSRRTPWAIDGRTTFPRAPSSWWVAATPAFRSRRSSRYAQGRALGRFPAEAAASAAARARSLLVAHQGANSRQDGRLTPGPEAKHARHADRLEPTRAPEALRGRAQACASSTPTDERFASRTGANSRSTPLSGRRAIALTTPGSSCPSSTRRGAYATAAASPMSRASTSSASHGSTRAARR